jgi:hypothetical protein
MVSPLANPGIPSLDALKYGAVLVEGQVIPCCIGTNSMVYIPIAGVCGAIRIPVESEIERIQSNLSLSKGLAKLPFQVQDNDGKVVNIMLDSISITRLHTWLLQIPAGVVPDEETRNRLVVMQDRLADVIYAYLGRPILPDEFRETMERPMPDDLKALFAAMEKVVNLEEGLDAVSQRVKMLEVALSLSAPTGSFIDKRQQEVYRQIIGIVGKEYEKKHPGQFGEVEKRLKEQFDFVFYKVIKAEQWENVIRSLLATYQSLVPAGTPVPQIFKDALKLKTQPPVNADQPGLFS